MRCNVRRILTCFSCLFLISSQVQAAVAAGGWVTLFDGTSLDDWTDNENKDSCQLRDGLIELNGERSHLFYTGPVENHDFDDFHLKMEVMTRPGANSGVFFHTRYQEAGSLNFGYEAQVNATHTDPRRTGSIFAVKDVMESPVGDDEWFEYEIEVVDRRVTVRVNGKDVNKYTEPEDLVPPESRPGRKLSHGTIALQAHDPGSTVFFRNIRIKTPATEAAAAVPLLVEPATIEPASIVPPQRCRCQRSHRRFLRRCRR